jgi:hypothetical protein
MKKVILIGILAVLLIPGSALALTYDFNSLTPGTYTETAFNSFFISDGVTFSNESGFAVRQFDVQGTGGLQPAFSGNAILSSTVSDNRTIARFTRPTDSVSVTLGDFNADSDQLFLIAYDSSGGVITRVGAFNSETSYAGQTLTVTSTTANIAWVAFGGAVGLTDATNSVVYWDNFTFNENAGNGGAAVPEPSTMLLLGTGLLGLVGISRRKLRS